MDTIMQYICIVENCHTIAANVSEESGYMVYNMKNEIYIIISIILTYIDCEFLISPGVIDTQRSGAIVRKYDKIETILRKKFN